jgi:hypothetical protein
LNSLSLYFGFNKTINAHNIADISNTQFEYVEETSVHTCPNPTCGKTFKNPLKALNLQRNTEPYSACPYCLTKIEETPAPIFIRTNEDTFEETLDVEAKGKTKLESPSACRFHVGYLSERAQKEQIPDDCLVCKDIVDCMLRKMRS